VWSAADPYAVFGREEVVEPVSVGGGVRVVGSGKKKSIAIRRAWNQKAVGRRRGSARVVSGDGGPATSVVPGATDSHRTPSTTAARRPTAGANSRITTQLDWWSTPQPQNSTAGTVEYQQRRPSRALQAAGWVA
jgi:hypothetical protein